MATELSPTKSSQHMQQNTSSRRKLLKLACVLLVVFVLSNMGLTAVVVYQAKDSAFDSSGGVIAY